MPISASEVDSVWRAVLAGVVDEIDTVIDELVSLVIVLPSYRQGKVDPAELRATARSSLRALVRAAAGEPGDLTQQSEDLGRLRAQQQVPAEEMARALRMDFEVLWSAVRRNLSPDSHTAALSRLDMLWRAVEEHARGAERGYLLESSRLDRESVASLDTIVSQLFGHESGRDAAAVGLARALAVPADAQFEVAAGTGEAAWHLAEVVTRAAGTPGALLSHREMDLIVIFWRTGTAPPRSVARTLNDIPIGITTAHGLAEIPVRARTAELIARALPHDHSGATRIDEAWPHLARTLLAETGLVDKVLTRLDAQPAAERDRLVATVRAVLSEGSVVGASRVLFCHRNTVIGRLARFRALTGLDLAQPSDTALTFIVLSDLPTAAMHHLHSP